MLFFFYNEQKNMTKSALSSLSLPKLLAAMFFHIIELFNNIDEYPSERNQPYMQAM